MEFRVSSTRIRVNVPNRAGLLLDIEQRLIEKKGFALATLNLDHLVKLQDPDFMRAYSAQDFVTADGNPIVWMSRLAHRPVELITGSDLIYPLTEVALRTKTKIGFIGSTSDALSRAAAKMEADFPASRSSAVSPRRWISAPQGRAPRPLCANWKPRVRRWSSSPLAPPSRKPLPHWVVS